MESKFSLKNHIFASYYKRLAKGLSYFKLHISMQKEFFFQATFTTFIDHQQSTQE